MRAAPGFRLSAACYGRDDTDFVSLERTSAPFGNLSSNLGLIISAGT